MATHIFVSLRLRPGELSEPQSRLIGKRLGVDGLENAVRDTDVGDASVAAKLTTRQEQMPGLEAEEGNRRLRLYGDALDGAGRTVHPARHIDGNDRQSAF